MRPLSSPPGAEPRGGSLGGDRRLRLLPDPPPLGDLRAGGVGRGPAAARCRDSHHVVRSSSSSAATASLIRGANSRTPSSGPARSGSPNRMVSWRRPVLGQFWPRGIAAKVPAVRHRHDGHVVLERRGRPRRSGSWPIQPSCERVPSGKITRLQPVGEHLAGRGRHGAAASVDRERVEEQRRTDRAPPGVEEVVGRRRDAGLAAATRPAATAGSAGCRGARRGWPRR